MTTGESGNDALFIEVGFSRGGAVGDVGRGGRGLGCTPTVSAGACRTRGSYLLFAVACIRIACTLWMHVGSHRLP